MAGKKRACETCGELIRAGDMSRHIKGVHKRERYHCQYCQQLGQEQTYTRQVMRDQHIKDKHSDLTNAKINKMIEASIKRAAAESQHRNIDDSSTSSNVQSELTSVQSPVGLYPPHSNVTMTQPIDGLPNFFTNTEPNRTGSYLVNFVSPGSLHESGLPTRNSTAEYWPTSLSNPHDTDYIPRSFQFNGPPTSSAQASSPDDLFSVYSFEDSSPIDEEYPIVDPDYTMSGSYTY